MMTELVLCVLVLGVIGVLVFREWQHDRIVRGLIDKIEFNKPMVVPPPPVPEKPEDLMTEEQADKLLRKTLGKDYDQAVSDQNYGMI